MYCFFLSLRMHLLYWSLCSLYIRDLFVWDLTSVGEGNETFLIRVWKPLPSRRVLRPWDWRLYVMEESIAWTNIQTQQSWLAWRSLETNIEGSDSLSYKNSKRWMVGFGNWTMEWLYSLNYCFILFDTHLSSSFGSSLIYTNVRLMNGLKLCYERANSRP